MTGALARYLQRRIGTRVAALAFFLVALMQVLELMDMTTEVLERGLGAQGLAYYAWLRLPSQVVVALPLAALIGAMWAFHELARHQELVAIRIAGVSLRQIVGYLLPVPLVVALLYLGLSQIVVPETEATLHAWWVASAPPDPNAQPTWIRTRSGPVSFRAASPDGRLLQDVRIYVIDPESLLDRRIVARSARWRDGAWHLEGAEALAVIRPDEARAGAAHDDAAEALEGEQVWRTNLRPEDVRRAQIAQPKLSGIMLADVIGGERAATQPLSYYRTALYRTFVTPLTPFVMLLLALPAARALPRRHDGAAALLVALVLGLAFLLCDGFMTALGSSGRVPPAVAALAAPLVFAFLGLLQLRFSEGR